jgi:hypothetical protein
VFSNADHITFDGFLPISDTNQPLIPSNSDLYRPVINLAQTILAAVRIDLGNPSPNNFILHPSTLNATLFSTFPASNLLNASASVLYQANVRPDLYGIQGSLPLTLEGPANIQVVYSCQFQQRKAPGSAFISVLVATLSMFSTGWGLCMFLAAYLAEHKESKQMSF